MGECQSGLLCSRLEESVRAANAGRWAATASNEEAERDSISALRLLNRGVSSRSARGAWWQGRSPSTLTPIDWT